MLNRKQQFPLKAAGTAFWLKHSAPIARFQRKPLSWRLFLCVIFILITVNNHCAANLTETAPTFASNKQLVGNIEKVMLTEQNIIIDAKLDTGADIASLSAVNIKINRIGKRLWVSCQLNLPSSQSKITLNKPLLRYMLIRKRNEERLTTQADVSKYNLRPVIELPICIGKQIKIITVNLVDRSNFHYPMLLGKEALKQFHFIVDVEKNYLLPPGCTTKSTL